MADPGTTSGNTTDYAPSEMPAFEPGEATPARPGGFPPYPPYATEPAPPSVADTIIAGRDLRVQYKSTPKMSVRKPPKPAKPRGPKAMDVKMSKRAMRAHARCLRRHGAVLTDRLERMAKPPRRTIIYLWRERANFLPAETIARLRAMLDADEPFKPDQAYEYFVNLRKTKKKVAAIRGVNHIKKDMLELYGDKRFTWARNATVAFARGIQQRLSRPGAYALSDGMLRLSNIILEDICGYAHMRPPSRCCTHPKAKFMMEMSDKVAVWIDEILAESDDRMLMMDFDEDDDIMGADERGDAGFADEFLNMMGDGGLLKGPKSAYLKFTGEMLEAFMILTESMNKKGDEQLLSHGKFNQTYTEAANELKQAPDFEATEYNATLANQIKNDLDATAKPDTPNHIARSMEDVIEICSNYLAQNAEFNKDKGPAFKLLVKAMHTKGNQQLFTKGKVNKTYTSAGNQLEKARGLDSDHDDPNLSQEIYSKLMNLVQTQTPAELKSEMADTVDLSSKYLSQAAIDQIERGPAFDLLIKELEKRGADPFTPQYPPVASKFATAYVLKSAPGFSGVTPDPETSRTFVNALHLAVDLATPKSLANDMNEVINRCANYLSAFVRDRDKSLRALLKMMKSKPNNELCKRDNFKMNYGTGAAEIEAAPLLVPFAPIKDIADEAKSNLNRDMQNQTPPTLGLSMKALIQDVSRYLSQPFALRSGIGGKRYPLNFLAAVLTSLGRRPLFKYKAYGQTYADAGEVLKYSGPLESNPKAENLQRDIISEMHRGVRTRLSPTLTGDLKVTMDDASKHLAKIGYEKGEALQHLVNIMKEEGDAPLGQIQGYQQSYMDGARRLENADSLTAEKVDKGTYESIREKLISLTEKKPGPAEHAKQVPGVVDESAKFLAAPFPESNTEKRRVLADLMARKGDEILGQDGIYKITYTEAGEEIMQAPVGVIPSQDPKAKQQMAEKLNSVIPEKKLQDLLKDSVNEGAAYLTDIIKGRGAAMQVLHDGMAAEKDKDFLTVGKFSKTYAQAAQMLEKAPHFGGQHPSPVLLDKVEENLNNIRTSGASEMAKRHLADTSRLAAAYIAGVATKEGGLDASAFGGPGGKETKADARTAPGAGLGFAEGSEVGASGAAGTSTSDSRVAASARDTERHRAAAQVAASTPGSATAGGLGPAATGAFGSAAAGAPGSATAGALGPAAAGALGSAAASASGFGVAAGPGSTTTGGRRRTPEEEEAEMRRQAREEEERRLRRAGGQGQDFDPEREQALQILHRQLRARGGEIFYKQPQTELTHAQASEWLSMRPPMKVDKSVKESGDTERLHKKFERKLSALVSKVTPPEMIDTMQDVIIESARILSEYFVSKNYKELVRTALISEMQKRGNEILIEVDGAAETYFFAAQRLKKTNSLEVAEPCSQVAYSLIKKLEDMIRCRSMARKLTAAMKDHIKDAADYLSAYVTKPDEQIEAYVTLLNEMEAAGDNLLIEGDIPKSFKDSAAYLRHLTSFQDEIGHSDSALQSAIENKLKTLMSTVAPRGYSKSVMNGVISQSTRLLVSYIVLQGIKTEALKVLIENMDRHDHNVLLRHGTLRKTYLDGADMLRTKNADQLGVLSADPVVARKIQIKLRNIMYSCTPDKYLTLMDDVIEEATLYLAVHFLQPRVIQVCKCMKNVFVQCELWCDEILRHVARPCCTCSRHVSAQALADLAGPSQRIVVSPSCSRAYATGIEIALKPCPSRPGKFSSQAKQPCPAKTPTEGCKGNTTPSYLLYSSAYHHRYPYATSSERLQSSADSEKVLSPLSPSALCSSPLNSDSVKQAVASSEKQTFDKREPSPIPEEQKQETDTSTPTSFYTPPSTNSDSLHTAKAFWQAQTTMIAQLKTQIMRPAEQPTSSRPMDSAALPRRMSAVKRGYIARAPIVTTDQMADWHAMMIVSPTRATVKTEIYLECQKEMLEIIDMFNRWTRWLTVIIKETDSITQGTDSQMPTYELRWKYFKKKVEEYLDDWNKYDTHLKLCWEEKYKSLISDWIPAASWGQPGPVWVVSACGAVPGGAVAAGTYEGEVTWVARTTHRCNVLPAALLPSKHCCIVYSDGAVHHYTKYQVMCNAEVSWVACRASTLAGADSVGGVGKMGARAVRIAHGVHVGRVHYRGSHLVGAVHAPTYRCHVVIFGRPFAFNCYELLVLSQDER
ncbi:uncharacterized protein LOC123878114 isoform X2 [Maniola jurtina]|uniref:uncharacterized protein LOC123878114 isoform X2 n=1 Tax=Maniola jurtina TaxID=191418 RepID=UPI001E688A89|nr:uncharacterized protein LOC123878114 isoform X2 [Maniola jurtina]